MLFPHDFFSSASIKSRYGANRVYSKVSEAAFRGAAQRVKNRRLNPEARFTVTARSGDIRRFVTLGAGRNESSGRFLSCQGIGGMLPFIRSHRRLGERGWTKATHRWPPGCSSCRGARSVGSRFEAAAVPRTGGWLRRCDREDNETCNRERGSARATTSAL
jgi:hypothetical protein